jgi:acetyltransferase-like isoleucine patch superfamily enzyme
MKRIPHYLYAKFRAFAPLSCLDTPRADVLRGWARWRWLARQRRHKRLIEPSVRVCGDLDNLADRLLIGVRATLDLGVILWLDRPEGSISLDEGVYVGPHAYLGTATHRVTIGAHSLIGAYSYIIAENHATLRRDIPYSQQGYVGGDVVIGANVWLGCHVTVLPGVTIGSHAIIGAGAVVTRDVPSGETWGGVPARKLTKRCESQ